MARKNVDKASKMGDLVLARPRSRLSLKTDSKAYSTTPHHLAGIVDDALADRAHRSAQDDLALECCPQKRQPCCIFVARYAGARHRTAQERHLVVG